MIEVASAPLRMASTSRFIGSGEEMVREMKEKVFPNQEVRYVRMDAQGKSIAVA